MTSITINAAGDHQYTPEALQVCIGQIWDCVDAAVSAKKAAQEIGRPVSMVRAAIGYGIKTGELVPRPDGRVEFARTTARSDAGARAKIDKRRSRAKQPVFRGSIGAAYAALCEAPLILAGRAAPSVWAWAQGVTVSTARHGGKHVEVRA